MRDIMGCLWVILLISERLILVLSSPPSQPANHHRLVSKRIHAVSTKTANSTHEVFVEDIGIIKEPTILRVSSKRTRSKRSGAMLRIEDPEWRNQWYLYRDPEPSLNVAAAWGVATGKGVVVGVVSDGVLRDHKDLVVDTELSYDFHGDIPQNPNSKGTQSAGVIAAEKNHLCGVGVAFDAKIADIRLIESQSTTKLQAEAMTKRLGSVDVYLHSWSKSRKLGSQLTMPKPLERALHKGASQGRNGKGSIYVWDTGKSNFESSCAYDPFINSKYTIPISGITKSQDRLKSGTACSAVLATAYSQNNNSNDHIVTTIGGSRTSCTDEFGESSAAAAMATGVIALALQANPSLTWRDVQHLLVHSSNALLLKKRNPKDFVFNGASLLVSNAFGFGLIDAAKLVAMATVWKPVGPAVSCKIASHGATIRGSTIQISPMSCNIDYLEHVEVEFNLTHSNGRGSVQLNLESPSGTVTMLAPGRQGDYHVKSFNWTVLSVQFWGENPSGGWKLTIKESPASKFSAGTAVLYGWALRFHGLVSQLEIPQNYPRLEPNLATGITEEEIIDTGATMFPQDFPKGKDSSLPWWLWLVLALVALIIVCIGVAIMRHKMRKERFRQSDEERTEEETQSLHQEKQQTTTA